MKSYTDIEQSKKLAEILPIESADGFYEARINPIGNWEYIVVAGKWVGEEVVIPCWSLAALLNYLREIDFFPEIDADEFVVTMSINYYNEEEGSLLAPVHNIKVNAETFIDACYEMILKIKERNLL